MRRLILALALLSSSAGAAVAYDPYEPRYGSDPSEWRANQEAERQNDYIRQQQAEDEARREQYRSQNYDRRGSGVQDFTQPQRRNSW